MRWTYPFFGVGGVIFTTSLLFTLIGGVFCVFFRGGWQCYFVLEGVLCPCESHVLEVQHCGIVFLSTVVNVLMWYCVMSSDIINNRYLLIYDECFIVCIYFVSLFDKSLNTNTFYLHMASELRMESGLTNCTSIVHLY